MKSNKQTVFKVMLIVFAIFVTSFYSYSLDTSDKDVPNELRLKEEDFEPELFEKTLSWIDKTFLPLLEPYEEIYFKWRHHFGKNDIPISLTKSEFEKLPYLWEFTHIGMANFQMRLEGMYLKQQVKISGLEYELLTIKGKAGYTIPTTEIDKAKQRRDTAKQKFQQFLKQKHWVD
ncbi:MAG: hypothetical protein HY805_09910 [Nitrospirae bacterium]|nr:hypothetical protein [Nitrospirota bacterium]